MDKSLTVDIEHLELGPHIGSGAFGTVHKASYLGIDVAVKVLTRAHHAAMGCAKDITHEVQVLRKLHHPNVVLLIGVADREDSVYIVEEFCVNGSLAQYLQKNQDISWETRLTIAIEIAQSLVYIHNKGILHRDLKSENVLMDKYFVCKICDFGLAQKISGSLRMSRNIGTPWWRAPEVDTSDHYTQSADVFSYGILLTEIITACSGEDIRLEMVDEKKTKGLNFVYDPEKLRAFISTYRPDCPADLLDLVISCCSINPTARSTMLAVLAKLRMILSQITVVADQLKASISDPDLISAFMSLSSRSGSTTTLAVTPAILLDFIAPKFVSAYRRLTDLENSYLLQLINSHAEDGFITAPAFNSIMEKIKNVETLLAKDNIQIQELFDRKVILGCIAKQEALDFVSSPEGQGSIILRFRSEMDKPDLIITGLSNNSVKNIVAIPHERFLVVGKDAYRSWKDLLDRLKADFGWDRFYPDIKFDSEELQPLFSEIFVYDGYAGDY